MNHVVASLTTHCQMKLSCGRYPKECLLVLETSFRLKLFVFIWYILAPELVMTFPPLIVDLMPYTRQENE